MRIANPVVIRFVRPTNVPVAGIKVYQSWECYSGLSGGGHDRRTSDQIGTVRFPARTAYGTVASRIFGRLFTFVNVHASFGSRVHVEFTLDVPNRIHPPANGTDPTRTFYLDKLDDGRQRVFITGDFLHNPAEIVINVE